MTQIEIPSPAVYVPVARSFLYKSLSLGFSYPTQSTYPALRDGRFMQDLWNKVSLISYLADLLPERLESIRTVSLGLRGLSFEEFETSYVATFGRAVPESGFPLPGSRHQEAGGDALEEEIEESYARIVLSGKRPGITCGLPDHLSAELEFLHFLTLKEFQAERRKSGKNATGCLQAQKKFLDRHLRTSLPKPFRKWEQSGRMPFLYSELARITSEYVRRDSQWIAKRLEDRQARVDIKKSGKSFIPDPKE